MFDHENTNVSPIILKRSRNKDLVVLIDFGAIPRLISTIFIKWLLLPLFYAFSFLLVTVDQATHNRTHMLMAMGLGIGVSLAMIVSLYPAYAQALPETPANPTGQMARLTVERIRIPAMQIDATVKTVSSPQVIGGVFSDSAVYQIGEASLGQSKTIVLQGFNSQLSFAGLYEAKLGQEVYVLGSNNGWYRFTVVETRFIPVAELSGALSQNQETLVLYSVQPFSQQVMVVVARANR